MRQEARAVALQNVRTINDRAAHLINLAREQAAADVRATQASAWTYVADQIQKAETYYRTIIDGVHAESSRQLQEAAKQSEARTADHVPKVREQAQAMLLAMEEQAASELRLVEEHAMSLISAARERAAATVRSAQQHADSLILAAQEAADEQVQQAEAQCKASHADQVRKVETYAAGLMEATRREADEHARRMHADAERRAAERIHVAEECAGILVQAAFRQAAGEVHEARARAGAAEEHVRKVADDAQACEQELQEALTAVEERMGYALAELRADLDHANHLLASRQDIEDGIREDFQTRLDDAIHSSETLRKRSEVLRRKNDSLRKKVERFPEQQARAVGAALEAAHAATVSSHTLKLKAKGIIPDSARALIRDLITLGVKVNQVGGIITTMAQASGVAVEGDISERSVSRIVGEGYLAAMMQIVEDVDRADGGLYNLYHVHLLKTHISYHTQQRRHRYQEHSA